MVDNVVSGVRWVASGLTFDYAPVARRSATNCSATIGQRDTRLASRILDASDVRGEIMARAGDDGPREPGDRRAVAGARRRRR